MKKSIAILLSIAGGLAAGGAQAHAIVGDRVFPATLAIDDPGVSDELTMPQVSRFNEPDGGKAEWGTAISGEFDKRLTENFGVSLEGAWLDNNGVTGWDNFGVGAKYVFYKNPQHELMLSTGLDWDIGGTGTKRIGRESFSTVTPALFFGKGMGDLPDSVELLKPFALTGSLGYAMPTSSFSTDPSSGARSRNGQAAEWGFAVQYSVPYLQQHVRDIGLPKPFANAIPIVEFAFETPTGGEGSGSTTGTINPGIIFMGDEVQLGVEAEIPMNSASGSGVGAMVQLHFYLDNMFPGTLGKPIW